MLTLNKLRESAVQMFCSQTGKNNHYKTNETCIAFVDGVKMYILPKSSVYEDFIEEKGYVYDKSLYIPTVEFQ